MEFRELPASPDHPRYLRRLREIDGLLRQRKERLVEEGMLMDRATAEDDFWWFCRRFTPFETYKNEEKGHPLLGGLWIDHPFLFWLCRRFQEQYVEPPDGWVWFEIHRKGFKTTVLLDSFLWLLARDPTDTIGLWTHKAEDIGAGMGRGLIHQLQTDKLRDHWPQFRNLQEGTKLGFTVDRPAGPRDQSVTILSIATSTVSLHPKRFALDDVESDKTYNNPQLIQTVSANISKIALMQHPGSTFTICNTPWDESGPLMSRARKGGFAGGIVCQRAMEGGDFVPAGTPNLHTKAFFEKVRRETADDALFYRQMEFRFDHDQSLQFDKSWLVTYTQPPEEIAKASPFIHFIVDGAKGTKHSDFAVIRVITWVAHDRWANLDLIRERVGVSAIMQILLGRDETDATSGWIERYYCPRGVGLIEKWMKIDPKLVIWFDDQGNTDWVGILKEMIRLRGVRFSGGRLPDVKAWPTVHRSRESTKLSLIEDMDSHYQQGHAAYPPKFPHGSFKGLLGEDRRDTRQQFEEDEYLRKRLGDLPPHDDMLDTEAQLGLKKFQEAMRRPRKGISLFGGAEALIPTTRNPWGIPGGDLQQETGMEGRTWMSM